MDRAMKRCRVLLAAALALAALTALSQAPSAKDKSEIVHQFLDAFNAHDAAAMAELVADDIQWLSVSDGAVSVELEGKTSLIDAMKEYFSSCTSCRSTIHSLISSGERVSAVEVASWMGRDGLNSQRSMAVYEFSGSLIQSVYYFSEEPDLDDRDGEGQ